LAKVVSSKNRNTTDTSILMKQKKKWYLLYNQAYQFLWQRKRTAQKGVIEKRSTIHIFLILKIFACALYFEKTKNEVTLKEVL
jgi:hypothetical protein